MIIRAPRMTLIFFILLFSYDISSAAISHRSDCPAQCENAHEAKDDVFRHQLRQLWPTASTGTIKRGMASNASVEDERFVPSPLQYAALPCKTNHRGLAASADGIMTTDASDSPPPPRRLGYFIHGYGGVLSDMVLRKVFIEPDRIFDFKQHYMLTVGGGAVYTLWKDILGIGVEGDAGLNWGKGQAPFLEFSAFAFLRYTLFPWSKHIPTALSVGNGFSVTTVNPDYIKKYGTIKYVSNDVHLLNLLIIDLEVQPIEHWGIFYRFHHRCSFWGAVGSYDGPLGINFHTVGIRYHF